MPWQSSRSLVVLLSSLSDSCRCTYVHACIAMPCQGIQFCVVTSTKTFIWLIFRMELWCGKIIPGENFPLYGITHRLRNSSVYSSAQQTRSKHSIAVSNDLATHEYEYRKCACAIASLTWYFWNKWAIHVQSIADNVIATCNHVVCYGVYKYHP